MRLEINQFGGMAPIIDPTALPDKFSTFAKNVRLDRGVLAPAALELEAVGDYPDGSLSGEAVKAVAKMLVLLPWLRLIRHDVLPSLS